MLLKIKVAKKYAFVKKKIAMSKTHVVEDIYKMNHPNFFRSLELLT